MFLKGVMLCNICQRKFKGGLRKTFIYIFAVKSFSDWSKETLVIY